MGSRPWVFNLDACQRDVDGPWQGVGQSDTDARSDSPWAGFEGGHSQKREVTLVGWSPLVYTYYMQIPVQSNTRNKHHTS